MGSSHAPVVPMQHDFFLHLFRGMDQISCFLGSALSSLKQDVLARHYTHLGCLKHCRILRAFFLAQVFLNLSKQGVLILHPAYLVGRMIPHRHKHFGSFVHLCLESSFLLQGGYDRVFFIFIAEGLSILDS